MQNEKYYSYDLYNTETEKVEATEVHTQDEVDQLNYILRTSDWPQRWIRRDRKFEPMMFRGQ